MEKNDKTKPSIKELELTAAKRIKDETDKYPELDVINVKIEQYENTNCSLVTITTSKTVHKIIFGKITKHVLLMASFDGYGICNIKELDFNKMPDIIIKYLQK